MSVPEITSFYTTEDVAEMLHCSTHYVSYLRKADLLVGTRYGKRWLYTVEDVEKFCKRTHGKDLTNFRDVNKDYISDTYCLEKS